MISENNYDGVLFDLNGNGIKVATQWVKGDDGLLVLDRNGNGLIDDGSELFGQDTPKTFITDTITDGFSALRQLDHNRDGKIDTNDADFKNIKVWRDINSDGISQEDELFSLEELKITSLDVETGIKNGHSTFTKEDGTTGKLSDIHFDMDTVHSEYVEHLPLSEEFLQLPNLHGTGTLRDLREAASLSENLHQMILKYSSANTKQEQMDLIETLIYEWAKTDSDFNGMQTMMMKAGFTIVSPTAGSVGITPSQAKQNPGMLMPDVEALANYTHAIKRGPIIDCFLGTETKTVYFWTMDMAKSAIKIINDTYEKIETSLYQGLLLQTRLKPYIDEIDLLIDHNSLSIDYHGMEDLFQQVYESNPEKAFIDLAELLVYGNLNDWHNGFSMLSQWAGELNRSGSLNDYLEILGHDVIDALSTQNGTDGDDVLTSTGLLSRDTLNGGKGQDTLIAGSSYTIMNGGEDADVYIFQAAFSDAEIHALDHDIIELKNISIHNLQYSRNQDDLILNIDDKMITIKNIFNLENNTQKPLQKIVCSDGEISIEQIKNHLIQDDGNNNDIIAYYSDDTIHIFDGNHTIDARGGNDTIIIQNGQNQIDAGDGNDTIVLMGGNNRAYGGDGDDVIMAGRGEDLLEGGIGSDRYIFQQNFGKDTVLNFNPNQENHDVLDFSGSLKSTQTQIIRQDNDLIIQEKRHPENILTVQNFFEKDGQG
ncbi:MAG: hypothetical protein IJR44_02700, partial [Neisseriaceae bacterium]|nr:hypothetical protein [Neisseriaceae bacterium]